MLRREAFLLFANSISACEYAKSQKPHSAGSSMRV